MQSIPTQEEITKAGAVQHAKKTATKNAFKMLKSACEAIRAQTEDSSMETEIGCYMNVIEETANMAEDLWKSVN